MKKNWKVIWELLLYVGGSAFILAFILWIIFIKMGWLA